MDNPRISVVIGSFNRRPLLKLCVDAVRRELERETHEIIVVDGGSSDGTIEWLVRQTDILSVIRHGPLTPHDLALGVKAARGTYICRLSDDSLIVPGAIVNGLDLFDEMREQDIKLGGIGFYFRNYPAQRRYAVPVQLGTLAIKHGLFLNSAIKEVGYDGTVEHPAHANADLCLSLKAAGYKLITSKASFVEHYTDTSDQSPSAAETAPPQDQQDRFVDKWKGVVFPEADAAQYKKQSATLAYHPRGFRDPDRTVLRLLPNRHSSPDIKPVITIATVVYDDAEGLERTIASVTEQTYPHTEFIVVDGASPAPTQAVLERHRDRLDILLSEPDNGTYHAMNKAIRLAGGDYLIFMNAGDTFASPEALEAVCSELDPQFDVVYGHRNYVLPSRRRTQESQPIDQVKYGMPFGHQAAFYKCSI